MATIGAIALLLVMLYLIMHYWEIISTKNVFFDIKLDKMRLTEGDQVNMKVEIINKKLMPLPIIKLELKVPIELIPCSLETLATPENSLHYRYTILTSLLCYQKVKKRVAFTTTKRGYFSFFEQSVVLADLFGITSSSIELQKRLSIIVHPRPENLGDLLINYNSLQGEKIVRRWVMPDSILYSGVRQYDINDSFKDIDWKATAKLGELYVKKYDYTSDPSLMIFIDIENHSLSNLDGNFLEKGIKVAASIINEAYKMKIPVGLVTNAFMKLGDINMVLPDISVRHVTKMFDMLACITSYKSKNTDRLFGKCISNCINKNTFIFISYELNDNLYKIIRGILNYNNKVQLILYTKNNNTFHNQNVNTIYMRQD